MKNTIYKIINKITGKSYVGRTNNLKKRIITHRNHPGCRYLHNAIKKYGWENFEVKILEECDIEKAAEIENKYIILENTLFPNGYNLILETNNGLFFADETINEIRSLKCQKNSPSNKKSSSYQKS